MYTDLEWSARFTDVVFCTVVALDLIHSATLLEGVGLVFNMSQLVAEGVDRFVEYHAPVLLKGPREAFRDTFDVGQAEFDRFTVWGAASGELGMSKIQGGGNHW